MLAVYVDDGEKTEGLSWSAITAPLFIYMGVLSLLGCVHVIASSRDE